MSYCNFIWCMLCLARTHERRISVAIHWDCGKKNGTSFITFSFLGVFSLSSVKIESACVWAKQKFSNCLPLLIAFEACESPFPSSYFNESARLTNPAAWWNGISKGLTEKDDPAYEFVKMAVVLHSFLSNQFCFH